MFRVSALGHQGWLVGDARTHVLIDPVLTPRFTRLPLTAATVYPPRRLELSGFPPLDAVLVSHEHPDHLDFASLQLLHPGTPVYMSAHTSRAARRVVASLGLPVRELSPGLPVRVGSLSVLPFAPPPIAESGSNEVDVVPLLVRDDGGHGSFFTSVDLFAQRDMVDAVRGHLDRPGVWADANSGYDRSLHDDAASRSPDVVRGAAERFARRYVQLFSGWGHPEVVMVTENGLTLGADLARLNGHVFEVPNDELIDMVRGLLPGHELRAASPGTTVELVNGELVAVHASLPFLAPEDRLRWPEHAGAPIDEATRQGFSPGTGRPRLTEDERRRLEQAMGELARFLFARTTFRGLYRLMAGRDHDASLRPAAALVLRDGESKKVWEYSPADGAFVPAPDGATGDGFVAGAEMWATDLLAVLTFQVCPTDMFHFGRKLTWNAAPGVFRFDLDTEIELFAHALHRPAAVESLYRQALSADAHPVLKGPAAVGEEVGATVPRRAPRARPVPASLVSAAATQGSSPGGNAASEAAAPEDPDRTAPFAEAVREATGAAWSVTRVTATGAVTRVEIALPRGGQLYLDTGPATGMPRHYRQADGLAFRYGPGSIDDATREVLDRVIRAVARALGAGL